jgi:hypothetical protein
MPVRVLCWTLNAVFLKPGWGIDEMLTLSNDPLEIYKAVEAPPVFSIHEYPKEKTCRTSCTRKPAMVELLGDTQRAFELGQRMLFEMVAKARSYR